jgi:hypothetical protein
MYMNVNIFAMCREPGVCAPQGLPPRQKEPKFFKFNQSLNELLYYDKLQDVGLVS